MKLHVTVESRTYEVDVELLDASTPLPSADSRVQSAPVTAPPKAPNGRLSTPIVPTVAMSGAAAPPRPAAAPPPPPAPLRTDPPLNPRPIWNNLSVGRPGEACSPIPGIIEAIHVKIGDAVKVNDAVITLRMTSTYVGGDQPMIGSVRTLAAGTIKEVLVAKGDKVAAGQVLVRIA
ncbi:MAG: hypothetical protein SFY96_05325 [Planctomycetota bacterium]|nr:hypothetical protein [Planctomycetota bacterium]